MSRELKVGTVNFHLSQNYGALMVTYALKTYLKRMGIGSLTVDYYPDYHKAMYPHPHREFQNFISDYLKPFGNPEEEYDLLIYGADTIWEYYKGYGYDDTYWGSDRLKAKTKITFSASGTMKNFSKESDDLFRSHLDNFQAISVREDVLAEYLRGFTSKPIEHTCDPTFLLTREDYAQVMSDRLITGEYAVIYNRQLGTKLFDVAKTVQQKTGLQTVVLKGDGCLYNVDEALLRTDIGPSEFLSLIGGSSYVMAASFHAVAFSIIFQKQFHTIMRSGAERVESLLRKAGLEDRRIGHSSEIRLDNPIDYASLFSMKEYIESSKMYLNTVLDKLENRKDEMNKKIDYSTTGGGYYIWGAAEYGKAALNYCKDKLRVIGFIDKRAGTGFREFCAKPVLSPSQFISQAKIGDNIIIAVSYPAEIVEFLEKQSVRVKTFIFDGRSKENLLLYEARGGEICVPEYMNKRFAEWTEYAEHYTKLNPFVLSLFHAALKWVRRKDKRTAICELGCGSGQFANMLFDNGYLAYTGVDFSGQAIDLAKKANPKHAGSFICADAFRFLQTCKKESSSLFILFEVLEHIQKDVALLNMLPSGSTVIFSVPSFKSFNHVRTFASLDEIKKRYTMLTLLEHVEIPAGKNADKVYYLIFADKN